VLAQRGATVAHERSARAEPLDERAVADLLGRVTTVWIARGRSVEERPAASVTPDDLRGPTGGFRAPILRRGKRLLVGLHRDSLTRLLAH